MHVFCKVLNILALIPLYAQSIDPATYGGNFGIRQIAVQIASTNPIPVYGPGNPALNQPGIYALANDIDGALVIEHDNIMLSLNGYRVKGDSLLGYGILVDGYNHITLGDGVVGPDTPGTVAASIKISNAQDIYLENCNLINAQQGINAQNSSNIFAKNCRSQFFTQTGFNEYACTTCIMDNCFALTSTTDSSNTQINVSGFSCTHGVNNLFQECQVKDLASTGTMRHTGFYLQDSDKIGIHDCTVDTVQTDSLAYGAYLFYRADVLAHWEGIPGVNTATNISLNNMLNASPHIAFDQSGNAMAVWLETGSSYTVYSRIFDGSTWLSATQLSTNPEQPAFTPVIAVDNTTTGKAIALWSQFNGTHYVVYARTYNNGWGTITTLSNTDSDAHEPQIAFDQSGSGQAIAVWQQNNATKTNIYARIFNGTTWEVSIDNLSNNTNQNAREPQIAFSPTGKAFAVWTEFDDVEAIDAIYARILNGTAWQSAQKISPGLESYMPQVAFEQNDTNKAVAVWNQYNDDTDEYTVMARLFDGTTWETTTALSENSIPPTDIPEDTPQIAFDPSGSSTAIAVWTHFNSATSRNNIYANTFNGSAWETQVNISNNRIAEAPHISFGPQGKAITVWREFNSDTDIYYFYARLFNNGTWEPTITNISNNPAQTAYDPDPRYAPQIAFDYNGNAMAIWPEYNGTNYAIYTRLYKAFVAGSRNNDCTILNNSISNIQTSRATGVGIYGDEQFNTFSQNVAAWCDLAYSSSLTNVQSGYAGSNFMYNIALPS